MITGAPFVVEFDWHYTVIPFIDAGVVGYIYKRHNDGAEPRIYLNASTEGETGPDAFVYSGPTGDPDQDKPVVFVDAEFQEL